jgi:hypothetical protein
MEYVPQLADFRERTQKLARSLTANTATGRRLDTLQRSLSERHDEQAAAAAAAAAAGPARKKRKRPTPKAQSSGDAAAAEAEAAAALTAAQRATAAVAAGPVGALDVPDGGIPDPNERDARRCRALAASLSDLKAAIAKSSYDALDSQVRRVDDDLASMEKAMKMEGMKPAIGAARPLSTAAAPSGAGGAYNAHEPVYCVCRQVAYGEMIACDSPDCRYEWFHMRCVQLTRMPRSTWLCPYCDVHKPRTKPKKH